MSERFAIYYAPAKEDRLTTAAESWLGRSAWTEGQVQRDASINLPLNELELMTAAPARYGFHATLKPPMRLRSDINREALVDAVSGFAGGKSPVVIDDLALRWIGPFLALVPAKQNATLRVFAADVVKSLEIFRAPLRKGETEKRRKLGLTPCQEEMLAKWGYPYVMEEFRFHMTLTGPVAEGTRASVEVAARSHFSTWIGKPLSVDRLAIFHEAKPGKPFTAIGSYALGGVSNGQENLKQAAKR